MHEDEKTPPGDEAPRKKRTASRRARPVEASAEVRNLEQPIRILIVDDEKVITDALRRYLAFEGYTIDVANDPYRALQMLHQGNYLLVISDIAMPGMSGVELLQRIKAYNGMIQVIMITGFVTLDNILTCLRLGADDCFLKPLKDMNALQKAVDEAIAKLRKWNRLMLDIMRGERAGE